MFDTYSTFVVVALVMTFISLWKPNILSALAGSAGWLALWKYNLDNPLGALSKQDPAFEFLHYAYIAMAIAVLLMYFWNRQRGRTGYPLSKAEEAEIERRNLPSGRGIMDLSPTEYQRYIRGNMRVRRRR